MPVPLVIAQLREPTGLEQLCAVVDAPQRPVSVGVQAWLVTTVPHELGVPVGVQPCVALGALPVHSPLSTVSPKLFTQVTDRLWLPLDPSHVHDAERDWDPLAAVSRQVALRLWVPLPLHTALAEHVPHAP